jgi:hypothetical protein
MLVYLHRYREEDAEEAAGDHSVDDPPHDSEGYFDVDELETDAWERVDYDGRSVLRKVVTYDGVMAISVPQDYTESGDLPGGTIQLRTQGGEEYVEQAVVFEVQDASPE